MTEFIISFAVSFLLLPVRKHRDEILAIQVSAVFDSAISCAHLPAELGTACERASNKLV